MLEVLTNAATGIVGQVLTWLIGQLLAPLDWLLRVYASAGALRDLSHEAWAANLTAGAQGIAGALLALRLAWEALQMASLRAEGAPTDPGGLLKRAAMAGAGIFGLPWIAREMLSFGNLLAQAAAGAGLGVGTYQLTVLDKLRYLSQANVGLMLFLTLPAVVLLILVFFQALVRTVEITLAAIISPLAALGYVSGGGMADVWWREVAVLSASQAVQMLLLYLSAALLAAPTPYDSPQAAVGPCFFLAGLWVAWRTPAILRNYAYSSGTRAAIGGAAQTAASAAAFRLLVKMPV